ncbi:MAG TPA: hypothetical protein VL738_10080 [Dactylosporangium sp.]|nr:hypothetical protein [Dactylosporangium sp.]
MNVWWYLAGTMYVISTMLLLLVAARLATANPSARLPWFGRPPNKPRGIEWLQMLAKGSLTLGAYNVAEGFWRRGDGGDAYDALWGLPFAVVVIVVGVAIPYARHNRRVRRAAL